MKQRKVHRGAASPAVVFALLLALIAGVVGAALSLGNGAEAPSAATTPLASPETTPDHSLTDAEAIARFKELDALRIRALEERDIELLRSIFTTDSPAFRRGRRSIASLIRSEVIVDDAWQLRDVRVIDNSPEEVELRVVGLSDAQFYDEEGNEVTQEADLERRVVTCLLQFSSEWVLHDCQLTRAEKIAE